MALSDGDLFVNGSNVPYQQMNRMLTNFWQATEPSNLQSGSLWAKSTNQKIYLMGTNAIEEVLQETRSKDLEPEFSGMNIVTNEGDVVTNEGDVVFNPSI
jgi:hypothetical protein